MNDFKLPEINLFKQNAELGTQLDRQLDEVIAGEYLGGINTPISCRTLQRWRNEGIGPRFIKMGRLIRYSKTDLDLWLETQRHSSTSEYVK